MSNSRINRNPLGFHGDASDDDIEILEVVGLDECDPADTPAPLEPAPAAADEDEIVLDLGEVGEDDLAAEFGGYAGADPVEASDDDSDQLKRLQADFENFKKRVDREQEESRRHAASALVGRLLPVLDNFERAVAVGYEREQFDRSFHDGVALIFRQLLDELRKEGLTAVDAVGELFDPNLHDAVATDPESGLPPNTIVEEMRRGYQLHDRLLRPALVKVAVGADESDTDPGTGEGN